MNERRRDASRNPCTSRAVLLTCTASAALALTLVACDRDDARRSPRTEAFRTGLVGTPTAGGGTSGEVIAANNARGVDPKEQGTPGIPRGAEGNVGGAQLGGTVDHRTSLGGSGEKSPAQAAKGEPARPAESSPGSPAAR